MHRKPDFLLVGVQKSGTSWLWERVLKPHPGTSLGSKEIHFFGGVENYRRGRDWYYQHFQELDGSKLIGEASTSYFFDRIPYWHNPSPRLEYETNLPTIPELVARELPQTKVIVILRDPVARAVSAYKHNLRKWAVDRRADQMLRQGLWETATRHPKARLLEYGNYERYLRAWREFFPPQQMRVYVFEEDVVREPEKLAKDVYEFLGLDSSYEPSGLRRPEYGSLGITRSWLLQHRGRLPARLIESPRLSFIDAKRYDFMARNCISRNDIEKLREHFLPSKPLLEKQLGRDLDSWSYGQPRAARRSPDRTTPVVTAKGAS